MKLRFCVVFLFITAAAGAQIEHYTSAYNDSVLTLLLKKVPKANKEKFKEFFNTMTDEDRSLFYVMHLPVSSKKELIKNVDTNYTNILRAIDLFRKLIPTDLEVSIEFKTPGKYPPLGESIDIKCFRNSKLGDQTPLIYEWNVEISSTKLDSLLTRVSLNRDKLEKLHASLVKANCISIDNKRPAEVGFARSGMGKYFYLIFDRNLTARQIKEYDNDCEYIFYKDNIVLMYGSGAIGSLCFPYEEPE